MATRNVEWLDTSLLDINEGQMEGLPKNPRSWTKDELNKLKKSLQETPELFEARPILAYDYDGRLLVLGGNMRLSAAKALGMAKVPVYVYPSSTPLEKLKEIVIKDNGAFGAWDWDMLANEWDALPLSEWGVPTWKVDEEEEHEQATAQEDDFDEEKDEIHVVCQRGDIWQLGEHRLMCGDSVDLQQVKTLLGGVKIDIVFTSPPYNGKNTIPAISMKKGVKDTMPRKLYNDFQDNMKSDDYVSFCSSVLDNCFAVTEGFIFWNVNYNANSRYEYIEQIIGHLPKLIEQVCWHKRASVPFKGSFKREWEPVYVFSTSGSKLQLKECVSNLWSVSNMECNTAEHKACFPVALPAKAMSVCYNCKNVLDPFGGSGTTLIAAEQLGRRCYMMEIDPHYCDIIIARWEKLTGAKAVKL